MAQKELPVAVFISNLRVPDDFTAVFPPELHDKIQSLRVNPGFYVSPPIDFLGKATGYLVLMLRDAAHVMTTIPESRALLKRIVLHAKTKLQADVVGLGSLTASITEGGLQIQQFVDGLRWPIAVTHGDAGSVAAILKCLDMTRPQPDRPIAIVGAYGVIGHALSRHLAATGYPLVLVGRGRIPLQRLCDRIIAENGARPGFRADRVQATQEMMDIQAAHRVITVTSAVSAVVRPEMLAPDAIVIDPAVPANVREGPWWHEGQLAITNASQVRLVNVRGLTSQMLGTYADPDGCQTGYACLVETFANAARGDKGHHVGEVDLGFASRTMEWFESMNLTHAVPRTFGRDCRSRLP